MMCVIHLVHPDWRRIFVGLNGISHLFIVGDVRMRHPLIVCIDDASMRLNGSTFQMQRRARLIDDEICK